MALEEYNRKRNFKTTPEPPGRVGKRKAKALAFIIQKHAASHLHYDFRLELDGVLLSWAVPKGPSLDPADRRLAMHVEDHPIEYGDFEGVIPPKQYGSGTVLLWDRGTWEPQAGEDPREAYRKGRLKFVLHGEKLSGGWTLVRTRGTRYGDSDKSWLLIKERDEHARHGADAQIVDDRPESVVSGRELDEIARDADRVWHSNRSVAQNVEAGAVAKRAKPRKPSRAPAAKTAASLASLAGARKAKLPATLDCQLATLVDEAPAGDAWIHEVKYDGYRMLLRIEDGECRIYSRNGKEWTAQFPALARDAARLPVDSAWLDGEVIAPDAKGRSSFQALQNALSDGGAPLVYYAFDIPYVDGYDLRQVPLFERKRVLRERVEGAGDGLRYSDHLEGQGATFFAEACRLGLEGIISKRRDAPYQATRSRDWQKVKCGLRQEFVIGGWTNPQGARSGFGALHLGYYDGGTLRYAGKVGTGFDESLLASLFAKLERLEVDEPPFADPPKGAEARRSHWVRPMLVGEVAFTEWTNAGTLRHPSFQGLREDKSAKAVVREMPRPAGEAPEAQTTDANAKATDAKATDAKAIRRTRASTSNDAPAPMNEPAGSAARRGGKSTSAAAKSASTAAKGGARKTGRAKAQAATASAVAAPAAPPTGRAPVAKRARAGARTAAVREEPPVVDPDDPNVILGVTITNPGKILYPEAAITKREIALYHAQAADWLVPHLFDRPLTLVRCPNGWGERKKKCFYQKHRRPDIPSIVESVAIRESDGGTGTYMMANNAEAVVALVQMAVLEFHPWGSRNGALDHPDRIVLDFDPDEALSWEVLVENVGVARALLDNLGLTGFLRTTGGKGLHVVLPIEPSLDWDTVKNFTKAIADLLARTFPDRFTSTVSIAKRSGKTYVDYLRNAEGATAIASYSARAKPHAPVAMPIAWDDLDEDIRFHHFNVRNAIDHLARRRHDPWADFFEVQQSIDAATMKRVGFVPR